MVGATKNRKIASNFTPAVTAPKKRAKLSFWLRPLPRSELLRFAEQFSPASPLLIS